MGHDPVLLIGTHRCYASPDDNDSLLIRSDHPGACWVELNQVDGFLVDGSFLFGLLLLFIPECNGALTFNNYPPPKPFSQPMPSSG
jgi:hypothetical protein